MYWEYDTRLGRRWNRDHVVKPWQSPYATFSGNPIWKIDPNGDDDYFNRDGTFAYSTETGTRVMIVPQSAKGSKEQTFIGFATLHSAENRKAVSNIATYYAEKIGAKGPVGLKKNSDEKEGKTAPAFTTSGVIYLNTLGGLSKFLNDAENFKEILTHEKDHQDGKGNDKYSWNHLDIYMNLIESTEFKNNKDGDFKAATVGGAADMLQKLASEELNTTGGVSKTESYRDRLNKMSKISGVEVDAERKGGETAGDSSDDEITITTKMVSSK